MKKIKIALFDDDSFVRTVMNDVFHEHENIVIAGTFHDANNLEADIQSVEPDLVLMDIEMPGINGIEAVRIIRKKFHKLPVFMLTQYDEEDKVIRSISAGANGYLLKTTPGEQMVERIEEVFNKESRIDPEVAKKFLDLFSESFAMRTGNESDLLTDTEKKVLMLLEKGRNYQWIADELNINEDDVKAHIKKVYEKLNVSSISGAVAIAMSRQLSRES